MNETQENCVWNKTYLDDRLVYSTLCGDTFEFYEGDPEDNGFKFCPFCGHPIKDADHI